MVELVRMFIKAERIGDFALHLHCVHRMLLIFHASDHFNYANFTHVYIQDFLQISTLLCDTEYDMFVNRGYSPSDILGSVGPESELT